MYFIVTASCIYFVLSPTFLSTVDTSDLVTFMIRLVSFAHGVPNLEDPRYTKAGVNLLVKFL